MIKGVTNIIDHIKGHKINALYKGVNKWFEIVPAASDNYWYDSENQVLHAYIVDELRFTKTREHENVFGITIDFPHQAIILSLHGCGTGWKPKYEWDLKSTKEFREIMCSAKAFYGWLNSRLTSDEIRNVY